MTNEIVVTPDDGSNPLDTYLMALPAAFGLPGAALWAIAWIGIRLDKYYVPALRFLVLGEVPQTPLLLAKESMPETYSLVTEIGQKIQAEYEASQALADSESEKIAKLNQDNESWRNVSRLARNLAKSDLHDRQILDSLAQLILNRTRQSFNAHVVVAGYTGAGKGAFIRAWESACRALNPNAIFVHINPKHNPNQFEYDNLPHYDSFDNAGDGIIALHGLMRTRQKDPNFNEETTPLVFGVINEFCDIIKDNLDLVPMVKEMIRQARSANIVLVIETYSLNPDVYHLDDDSFKSFVTVVLGGLQRDYIQSLNCDPLIKENLSRVLAVYEGQGRRNATVVPVQGTPKIYAIPILTKAYQDRDKPLPPQVCPGLNQVSPTVYMPKKGDFKTSKGDAWILANHQLRETDKYLRINKAAKLFEVGSETYTTRLNELLKAQKS